MGTAPLRSHLPSVPDALAASGVGTWDDDPLLDVNHGDAAFAFLFGLSVEECARGVSSARLLEALHPDDRAISAAKWRTMGDHGGIFVSEYRTLPRPDVLRWVLVRGRYEKDQAGRVVRGCGIVVDITDSKVDGFGEGRASFVAPTVEADETSLERAARHVIAARHAIDEIGGGTKRLLRPLVDILLMMIGRCLTRGSGKRPGH